MRFVWKQYRFELMSVTIAIAAMVGAVLVVTWRLNEVALSPDCLDQWWQGGDGRVDCRAQIDAWVPRREDWLFWLVRAIPYVAGILLGSVLVSREIEHRTAQLGWSLIGSRARWLGERVLPVAAMLGVALLILALATVLYAAARMPGVDPRASFNEYGASGLPVVVRGLAVFAGSALIGAVVGRQLPALIVAGGLALALGYALTAAFPFGAPTEWLPEEQVANQLTDVTIDSAWRASDGEILSYAAAAAMAPDPGNAYDWVEAHFSPVVRVLHGAQLLEVELRESLALAGIATASLGVAQLVLDRRRPY